MRNADLRLAATYARANAPDAYTGEFYPGPHRFDVPMQEAALAWLRSRLCAGPIGAAETGSRSPP